MMISSSTASGPPSPLEKAQDTPVVSSEIDGRRLAKQDDVVGSLEDSTEVVPIYACRGVPTAVPCLPVLRGNDK